MKISGRRDYLFSLENIAMTDIIMNMFIFFFISFSLLYTFSPERIQKLDIKLPEATNTAPLENKNQVDIVLTGDVIEDAFRNKLELSVPKAKYTAYGFGTLEGLLGAAVAFQAEMDPAQGFSLQAVLTNAVASY